MIYIGICDDVKTHRTMMYETAFRAMFEFDEVDLRFEDDAIVEVAKKALERKTGARGIRSIMESVLMDVMYQIPSDDTIVQCMITKQVIDGTSEPLVVHREAIRKAR